MPHLYCRYVKKKQYDKEKFMKASDFFLTEEGKKYLSIFRGKIFIIKYGGAALENREMMKYFLEDVSEMHKHGIHVVLVHGGGKDLSQKMAEQNIPVQFENGIRVTTLDVVKLADQVFSELNEKICAMLVAMGCKVTSIVGGRGIYCSLLDSGRPENYVGDVKDIDEKVIDWSTIPVISSIGRSHQNWESKIKEGTILNVNADHLALFAALALKARKLIFISDVNGIYGDIKNPETRYSHITESGIQELIDQGILHGGMRLKVEMALKALKGGVNKVHFLDGGIEHSLIREIFTEQGVGTEIVHDE